MKIVVKSDPVYRRRRAVALLALALVLALLVLLAAKACAPTRSAPVALTTTPAPTSTTPSATTAAPVRTHLVLDEQVSGQITPRSLAASSTGLVLAANMMYRHTITAYDPAGTLVATTADSVSLADLGVTDARGTVQGAPVESVFTPDGATAYVTNYSMTGPGFGAEPVDSCRTNPKAQGSYLYRYDAAGHKIDQVIAVGAVPKDLAVTPDGRAVVVANWCSGDLSLVDTASAEQTARVPVGEHPRGVAVSPDGATAYVLTAPATGPGVVTAVDLAARSPRRLAAVGPDPRRIAVAADGTLLVTSAGDDTVRRIDPAGKELARVTVADQPRSLTLSRDGATVYVVAYGARKLQALRATDLGVRSEIATPDSPTGLVVEPTRGLVWVAGYKGTIALYREVPDAAPTPTTGAGTSTTAPPTTRTSATDATTPASGPSAGPALTPGPLTGTRSLEPVPAGT